MAHTSAQRRPSGQSEQQSSLRSTRSMTAGHASMRQSVSLPNQPNRAQTHDASSQSRRSRAASVQSTTSTWWHVHLFRGMVNDVKRRAPYYWSDWTDAWDYRVVPATVYMYFAKYVNPVLGLIYINCHQTCLELTIMIVSCRLWLFHWICLRKLAKAMA